MKKALSVSIVLFILLSAVSIVRAGNNFALLSAQLVWGMVVAYLCFCIFRTNNISKYRSILFILIAFFFFVEFKLSRFLCLSETISPYCHIAQAPTLFSFIHNQYLAITSSEWRVWGVLSLGFLWLFIMLVIGQGICSWVCFYGGIDEACSKLAKKPLIKLRINKAWRDFPLAFLIFLLIISFLQGIPVFCNWFCPFKLTKAFWDNEPLVRGIQAAFFLLALAGFTILFPMLTKKRTFCALICPFGAMVSICGKVSPYRVTINKDKCVRCGKCQDVCPVFAIDDISSGEYKISSYCNKCAKCSDICPKHAINFTVSGTLEQIPLSSKPKDNVEVKDIFIFISLLLAGVISGGFVPQAILRLLNIK